MVMPGGSHRSPQFKMDISALIYHQKDWQRPKRHRIPGHRWQRCGSAPGLPSASVFVHGAISDMRVWNAYRARIAGKRRFIAYTQRYFGTDEWPDKAERFSRETHTEDLID